MNGPRVLAGVIGDVGNRKKWFAEAGHRALVRTLDGEVSLSRRCRKSMLSVADSCSRAVWRPSRRARVTSAVRHLSSGPKAGSTDMRPMPGGAERLRRGCPDGAILPMRALGSVVDGNRIYALRRQCQQEAVAETRNQFVSAKLGPKRGGSSCIVSGSRASFVALVRPPATAPPRG